MAEWKARKAALRGVESGMALQVWMAADVREWLRALVHAESPLARHAGGALVALLERGPSMGPPLVAELPPVLALSGSADAGTEADAGARAYQRQLELVQQLRRAVADVAVAARELELESERLETSRREREARIRQALAEDRKDVARREREELAVGERQRVRVAVRLSRTREQAADLQRVVQRTTARLEELASRTAVGRATRKAARGLRGANEVLAELGIPELPGAGTGAAEAALAEAQLEEAELDRHIAELDGEARGLLTLAAAPADPGYRPRPKIPFRELRLRGPGSGRILFATETDGTVALLAAAAGEEDWGAWYRRALPRARDHLSGGSQDSDTPRAPRRVYGTEALLAEFFPETAAMIRGEAARVVGANHGWDLASMRRAAGLTQQQVARQLQVPEEEVTRIERTSPGHTGVLTLAAYFDALGGSLEITARLGGTGHTWILPPHAE